MLTDKWDKCLPWASWVSPTEAGNIPCRHNTYSTVRKVGHLWTSAMAVCSVGSKKKGKKPTLQWIYSANQFCTGLKHKHLSPNFQQEQRVNELIREKENMATEIWKLKQELEKRPVAMTADQPQTAAERHNAGWGTARIDDYQPGSAAVLRRKLGAYVRNNKCNVFWELQTMWNICPMLYQLRQCDLMFRKWYWYSNAGLDLGASFAKCPHRTDNASKGWSWKSVGWKDLSHWGVKWWRPLQQKAQVFLMLRRSPEIRLQNRL